MIDNLFIDDGYVKRINIVDASDEKLLEISKKLSLGFYLHEMKKIKDYFESRGRMPSDLELEALAQSW
ncbi:MAG TPA: hypothetical protein ENJ70_00015, partial [Thermoplasmatales archaeon]|nr:hypothetical protein [Thermoplasmatales archaeon]